MTARWPRAIELVAAALLATFGVAKFVLPSNASDRPTWYQAALVAAAVVELVIAAWLARGGSGARPVAALASLGAALVVFSVAVPASWLSGGCGCLGSVHLEQGHRVLAGSVLVLLAGLRLALGPPGDPPSGPPGGTHDPPPNE